MSFFNPYFVDIVQRKITQYKWRAASVMSVINRPSCVKNVIELLYKWQYARNFKV